MLPGGLPWRGRPFPTGPGSDTERMVRVRSRTGASRQTAITRPVTGAIHRDMHISVARSGELCDGGPYLGGPEGVRSTAMQNGPAVRRRKLGAELRSLRVGAGLTSGEAARLLGWHQSKVSRIETGTSGVKPPDVE